MNPLGSSKEIVKNNIIMYMLKKLCVPAGNLNHQAYPEHRLMNYFMFSNV